VLPRTRVPNASEEESAGAGPGRSRLWEIVKYYAKRIPLLLLLVLAAHLNGGDHMIGDLAIHVAVAVGVAVGIRV
jgi:hypothetical protein